MSEVDLMVKQHLLAYPTLHATRFGVLATVFDNSGFGWSKDGAIIPLYNDERVTNATPETMVAKYEERLAECRADLEKEKIDCLRDLSLGRIAEAEMELLVVKHRAANIDVFARTWAGADHPERIGWLFRADVHGPPSGYAAINNVPANVTDVWREAMRDWLRQLLPTCNSYYGMMDPYPMGPWKAKPGREKVFNWLKDKYKELETEEHRRRMAWQVEATERIVAKLKAEEQAENNKPKEKE